MSKHKTLIMLLLKVLLSGFYLTLFCFQCNIPIRVVIAIMIFTAVFMQLALRVILSINIVKMVPLPLEMNNTNTTTPAEEQETLGWSAYERGMVLGAFYWGYILACLFGGPVANKFGPRLVILLISLAGGVLTIASPAAAKTSFLAMLLLRMAHGLFSGFFGASAQMLIAHWAPKLERGKFVGLMTAGTVGTVASWSLCGVIIEALGWESAFYIFGVVNLVWCVSWWFLVYDNPESHPRISEAEKKLIKDGTSGVSRVKENIPYVKILTSGPVWALTVAGFGTGWGAFFILNAGPIFIANVLHFNLAATGLLASITYLMKSVCSYAFGTIGDVILKRKLMSLLMLRKSFCLFSHIIPGLLLIVLTFTRNSAVAICFLTLGMGLHSASSITSISNCQDIAPNFAGSIFGLVGAGMTVGGIITPMVVAFFTKGNERSFDAWKPVFYTGASVYIVTAVIFIIFGSTEVQPWNHVESRDEEVAKELIHLKADLNHTTTINSDDFTLIENKLNKK